MKIAFIIGSLNYSGAEKVFSIITKELCQENNIHVLLLKQKRGVIGHKNGLTTYGVQGCNNAFLRIPSRLFAIRKAIKTIKPDIIVSFGNVCNVNSIVALFGIKIPLVVCERNDPSYDPRTRSARIQRDFLYRLAEGFVFQTKVIRSYFRESIQKKSAVIPNAIIDCGLRWNNFNAREIVTIARLDDEQKNHTLMFEAFELFLKKHPEYSLKIIGDGPDLEKEVDFVHNHHLQNNVVFCGKKSNPQQFLLNAEIFLLTSRFEGMPNALMEAMSIGMPCVSTDCGGGGAAELINEYGAGYLVLSDNSKEIASALCRVAEDDELKKTLSANSLRINEKLHVKAVAKQWMEYLRKVKETY